MWKYASSALIGLAFILTMVNAAQADEPKAAHEEAEKEEVAPVSKSDFSAAQTAMFNKADADFDGKVSYGEIQEIKAEGQRKANEKRFKKLDTDFSGYLTEDEILAAHEVFKERGLKSLDQTKSNLMKTYDLDKNGTISEYEIDQVLEKRKEKSIEYSEKNAKKDFERKDKDGSGIVSLEEYVDNRRVHSKRAGNGEAFGLGKYISRDGNGDRMISRSENAEYVDAAFDYLDKNQDGELSAKEQGNMLYKFSQTMNDQRRLLRLESRKIKR